MVSPATLWQILRIYFKTVVLEVSVNKCQTEETYLWFETPCYYRFFAAMPVEIPLLCLPLFPFSFSFFVESWILGKPLSLSSSFFSFHFRVSWVGQSWMSLSNDTGNVVHFEVEKF